MQVPDFAREHQDARLTLALAADSHLSSLWDRVDPDDIMLSWLVQLPEATLALTGAQLAAANLAEGYVADSAVAEGISELPETDVVPRAFAGVASDGRQLANLLAQPAVGALSAIKSGQDVPRSMAMGRTSLSMIAQTQVADAGRGADQVALTGYRQLRGYVRVVQGDACSRCIILAGRVYRWSAGFKRHPNCMCVHLPRAGAELAGIRQTPQQLYSLMTSAERRLAGWSLADQAAIDAGADIFQVTNARQGMYTAGGRRYTTVGTTRRAIYGGYDIDPVTGELTKRPRGAPRKAPRLTVDQIFAEAKDRDEALALLRRYGYATAREPVRVPGQAFARPSAAVVDPALKLTVATLKQIARDNGVDIAGVRLKADILGRLRNHEDIHRIKLSGLPEFKMPHTLPTRAPTLAIDAAPLPVPASQPVLSGAALNDWADYLKYDRQYKRFEFVDANGNTPPEGIRVHNLRANIQGSDWNEYMVHDGTVFSFDGVAYLIEHRADQFGSPWVSKTLADLRAAHESIPAAKLANRSYAALGGDNPADEYWRKRFNNPGHTSAAMAARGHVTLWQFRGPATPGGSYSRVNLDVLRHETGHNLDDLVGRTVKGSESPAWLAAAKSDVNAATKIRDVTEETPGHGGFAKIEPARDFPAGVTDYGRSSVIEDYAESVRLYQEGVIGQGRLAAGAEKGPIYFRDLYPARAKILDDIFPDIAKAQKAEITALRAPKPAAAPMQSLRQLADLSKLKVPELRALAKERGITNYSKLTKPQLLEKLGGTGTAKTAKTAEDDLVTIARKRQADIDYARARAELLSETEEWLNNQGSLATMAVQLRRDALRYGIEGHKDMAALFRAIDAGDEVKVRRAILAAAKKQNLTRVEPAGELVKFDRALHVNIGKDLKPGEWAVVVRPGYTYDRSGELIRLHKAKVEKATAQEIAAAARATNKLSKTVGAKAIEHVPVQPHIEKTDPQRFEALRQKAKKAKAALDAAPVRALYEDRRYPEKVTGLAAPKPLPMSVQRAVTRYMGAPASINNIARLSPERLARYVGDPEELQRTIRSATRYIHDLDRAMDASPLSSDVVVYRGIPGERVHVLTKWLEEAGITGRRDFTGLTWTDGGFVSTSTSREYVRSAFADASMPTREPPILLRIIIPRGTGALRISDAEVGLRESELLLDRGLTFRVVADHGVEHSGYGARILDVEVVPG